MLFKIRNILASLLLTAGLATSGVTCAAINQNDHQAALATAEKMYDVMLGEGAAHEANWESPKLLADIKDPIIPGNTLHVLEFSVMDPTNGAYQRIHVLVNIDGGVAGAEILYAGR
ncbi:MULTISPECIES: hypothetical protein [Atlantibacter]|uniref:PepSY domain-containing protein n=1 Tax=Atlantibacter subterraneus TaxID=255519 RepID=A0ABU4E862_9ENTR|nr:MULTISPECIES: hypothetical protein [Atlantibacter]MBK4260747.1 hypothetical protein [Enterobacter hormaechei]MDV7025315.1 hypothetical protein [Atlantibacter subterranea]MDZ5668417.1 hypothetical protein [Atlantibacter hermannii]QFH70205.1 hypothetical protein FR762_10880 [Enterobacter sp. E76]